MGGSSIVTIVYVIDIVNPKKLETALGAISAGTCWDSLYNTLKGRGDWVSNFCASTVNL